MRNRFGPRWGEALGWIAGFVGSFLWVAVLAAVFLGRGQRGAAAVGFLLCGAAFAAGRVLAPWRHPTTAYGWLLVPYYILLGLSIPWAIWGFGGLAPADRNAWLLLLLLPVLTPLATLGRRRWAVTAATEGPPDGETPRATRSLRGDP